MKDEAGNDMVVTVPNRVDTALVDTGEPEGVRYEASDVVVYLGEPSNIELEWEPKASLHEPFTLVDESFVWFVNVDKSTTPSFGRKTAGEAAALEREQSLHRRAWPIVRDAGIVGFFLGLAASAGVASSWPFVIGWLGVSLAAVGNLAANWILLGDQD